MTKLPKIPKPHYEKKKESIIVEKFAKVDSKKVILELEKIIKKGRELEEKFRMKRDEAIL